MGVNHTAAFESSTGFPGAAGLTSTIRPVSVTPWVTAAGQKAEGSRRKAVGSRQKAVSRRQRAIGNDQRAHPSLFAASAVVRVAIFNFCLLPFGFDLIVSRLVFCRLPTADCFLPAAWSEEDSQAQVDVVGRGPRSINLGCPQTAVLERKQQIRAQVVDTVDEGALVPTERGVNIALALRKAPQVRREGVVLAERAIEFQSLRRLEFELCPSSGRIEAQHRSCRV